MRAHPPRAPDVVLEARATDRRQLVVAVAEDLHLAFAVPVAGVDHTDADRAAEEAARSLEAVDDHEVALLHRGVLPAEPHMQVSGVFVERPERVVDLVVEDDRALAAVRRHDAHVLAERHGHVAVEAPSLLHGVSAEWYSTGRPWGRPKKSTNGTETLGSVEAVVEDLDEERSHDLGGAGGIVIQMWRIVPGPSMSASTTDSPARIRMFGAPLRPPCAEPPAPAHQSGSRR